MPNVLTTDSLFSNRIVYLADVDGTAADIAEARAEPLTGKFLVHDTNFVSAPMGGVEVLAGVFYL